jgi:hypothetical protein
MLIRNELGEENVAKPIHDEKKSTVATDRQKV